MRRTIMAGASSGVSDARSGMLGPQDRLIKPHPSNPFEITRLLPPTIETPSPKSSVIHEIATLRLSNPPNSTCQSPLSSG